MSMWLVFQAICLSAKAIFKRLISLILKADGLEALSLSIVSMMLRIQMQVHLEISEKVLPTFLHSINAALIMHLLNITIFKTLFNFQDVFM